MEAGQEQDGVAPDELEPGTEVGRWRVVEQVGVGGQGAVYRVEDTACPGHFRALKLALDGQDARAAREWELMTRAVHPHVVRVHDRARWPDPILGHSVFLMDWVEGQPLDVFVERENPSFRQLAHVGGTAALALHALHERGVLHRDLKPEHILIRALDGEPVLLDLGAGWYEGAPPLTRTTLPPGTLHLRSPEAVRYVWKHGRCAPVPHHGTRAEDLYALGVCLYRAVTGHYPFSPELPMDMLQYAIVHGEPPAPSDFNRRVPRALSEVLMRLLAKEPGARPASGQEVHAALVAAVALGEPAAWDAPLFEWEEAAAPQEGEEAPARHIRRPAWPTQPVRPPEPRLGLPPSSEEAGPTPEKPRAWGAGHGRVWAGLVLAALLVWGLALLGGPGASAPSPPVLQAGSGREVAPAPRPPEAVRAAAPPLVEKPPAAVPSRVTPSQDRVAVKKQQPAPKHARKKNLAPALALCLGAAQVGCTASAPPRVRETLPPLPSQACPPEALEAMQLLGIPLGAKSAAYFPNGLRDRKPRYIPEGPVTVELAGRFKGLPDFTVLSGRVYHGKDRLYGRFTEARHPGGRVYPVCMEMLSSSRDESGADSYTEEGSPIQIAPIIKVRAVARFPSHP